MRWAPLVPELAVSDIARSLDFYVNLSGFEAVYERAGFAYLALGEAQLMLAQEPGDPLWKTAPREYPYGRGINLQIDVLDVEALRKRLLAENYPIKVDLQTNWYRQDDVLLGNLEFLVMDPDGYLLRFAQDFGELPADSVRM